MDWRWLHSPGNAGTTGGDWMDEKIEIRSLDEGDAEVFRALHLWALDELPEAFLAVYEEELCEPLERVAERLRGSKPENFYLGVFVNGHLVGMVHFERPGSIKIRHRAYLSGMYVAPERRGQGLGKALLDRALAHARSLPDLEEVGLWVIIGNQQAEALYQSAGFETFCIEPRSIKIDDRYYDGAGMIMRLR